MKRYYYRYGYIGFYNGKKRTCKCYSLYECYKDACDAAADRIEHLKYKGWSIGQTIIEMVAR